MSSSANQITHSKFEIQAADESKTEWRYRRVRNRHINIRSRGVSMFSIRIIKIEIDPIGRRIPSRYSS